MKLTFSRRPLGGALAALAALSFSTLALLPASPASAVTEVAPYVALDTPQLAAKVITNPYNSNSWRVVQFGGITVGPLPGYAGAQKVLVSRSLDSPDNPVFSRTHITEYDFPAGADAPVHIAAENIGIDEYRSMTFTGRTTITWTPAKDRYTRLHTQDFRNGGVYASNPVTDAMAPPLEVAPRMLIGTSTYVTTKNVGAPPLRQLVYGGLKVGPLQGYPDGHQVKVQYALSGPHGARASNSFMIDIPHVNERGSTLLSVPTRFYLPKLDEVGPGWEVTYSIQYFAFGGNTPLTEVKTIRSGAANYLCTVRGCSISGSTMSF